MSIIMAFFYIRIAKNRPPHFFFAPNLSRVVSLVCTYDLPYYNPCNGFFSFPCLHGFALFTFYCEEIASLNEAPCRLEVLTRNSRPQSERKEADGTMRNENAGGMIFSCESASQLFIHDARGATALRSNTCTRFHHFQDIFTNSCRQILP